MAFPSKLNESFLMYIFVSLKMSFFKGISSLLNFNVNRVHMYMYKVISWIEILSWLSNNELKKKLEYCDLQYT